MCASITAAKPPRKYISRQRLCLRGTTDYWVNDSGGLPCFVIDKAVDSGLLDALREDIVPRLLKEVRKLTAGGRQISLVAPPSA